MGWLKDLFGGAPKPPPKKAAAQKTYKAPSNRAALIAEAMAVREKARANAQDVLEAALKEMQRKPPRPSDVEGMTRLLSLRNALLTMKGHMADDLKRYQVLAGVQGLLESAGKRPQGTPQQGPGTKSALSKPPSLGSRR